MGLDDIIGYGAKILDKVIPDPKARDEAKLRLIELQQAGELAALQAETDLAKGQQAINLAEAGSSSLFVSGWRPFIGWVCGFGLCYQFVIRPLVIGLCGAMGINGDAFPELNIETLLTLLLGMLGLGGLRSFEKVKGVTR